MAYIHEKTIHVLTMHIARSGIANGRMTWMDTKVNRTRNILDTDDQFQYMLVQWMTRQRQTRNRITPRDRGCHRRTLIRTINKGNKEQCTSMLLNARLVLV